MKPIHAVIAGGGPSAAFILAELATRDYRLPLETITILDPRTPSGGGSVHSDPSPAFRVNMRTNLHNIPGVRSFEAFLEGRSEAGYDPPRRYDLGLYTEFAAEQAIAKLRKRGCAVRRVAAKAVFMRPIGNAAGYVVGDDRGGQWPATHAVLAIGHEPPSLPQAYSSADPARVSCYTGDSRFADRIDVNDRVTVLGTGPGAIDVARYLIEEHGVEGPIRLVSRHGLLSAVQTAEGPPQSLVEEAGVIVSRLEVSPEKPPLGLLGARLRIVMRGFDFGRLLREARLADPLTQLRRDIEDAANGGPAWRLGLEAIGVYAPRLWRWMGPEQQERLMKEEDGLWMRLYYTKRHAMQRGTSLWLAARMAEGRITMGRAPGSELPVHDRLVVATGPEYRVSRSRNPLMRQMPAEGLARPHAAPSGYEIGGLRTHNFGLPEAPGVWAMGSLLRGEDFAVHGYPSLARHAKVIVAQWQQ
jgi:uncharacterized NAD(P)/FAD-binding protein YdhS